jgi:hypothetical protein
MPTPARVDGKISALSGKCPDVDFTVSSRSITTDISTIYRGGKCGDLKNGVEVDVDGLADSNGLITATSIGIE